MKTYKMIDNYVYAITKRLPSKGREDIAKELTSLIWDEIDSRFGEETVTDDMITEILLDLGSPVDMANKYRSSDQYLIGPELFDLYKLILIIVTLAGFGGITIAFIINSLRSDFATAIFTKDLIQYTTSLFSSLLSSVGMVTLIFAFIEKKMSHLDRQNLLNDNWHPKKLDDKPLDQDKFPISEGVANILFTLLFLILLNQFADKIGAYSISDTGVTYMQILSVDTLGDYLPFINVLYLLSIALNIYLLKESQWTRQTRIINLLLSFAGFFVFLSMVTNKSLFDLSILGSPAGTGIILGIKIGIAIGIIAFVFDSIKHIVQILKTR